MGAESLSIESAKDFLSRLETGLSLLERRNEELAIIERRIDELPGEIDRIARAGSAVDSDSIGKKARALAAARNELSALKAGLPSLELARDEALEKFREELNGISRILAKRARREQRELVEAIRKYVQPLWEGSEPRVRHLPVLQTVENDVQSLDFRNYPKSFLGLGNDRFASARRTAKRLIKRLRKFCEKSDSRLLDWPAFLPKPAAA